jgi:peptide/nickel transport system permease protein
MTVVDSEFIEAARAAGATKSRIMFTHILPNAFAPIIVQATMRVGSAITMASSLSFLGLGIPAPAPEWGGMLSESRSFIRDYSYMTLFPGLAIVITVLSINLIGDGLRDAMDPKLKR